MIEMRVLVVETDRHSGDQAAADLEAAGHRVVRCHDAQESAFPCNALRTSAGCPLDAAESVDVVLDYRSRPRPRPTPFEDGVSCAVRHHIPLVVAGTAALNPYHEWTTAVAVDGDIVSTCEESARARLGRLEEPARAEVQRRLGPSSAPDVDVEVRRRGNQLDATIHVPTHIDDLDGKLAVAVAGVLRAHDRFVSRVNVAVKHDDGD
jgi:hypothetical protein